MNETESIMLQLRLKIDNHKFWLSDGRMSNPIKIKYRERALKKAKKELKELKSLFDLD